MPDWKLAAFGQLLNSSSITWKSDDGAVNQSARPIQVTVCNGWPRVIVPRRIHHGLKSTSAEIHFVDLEPTIGVRLMALAVVRNSVRGKSQIDALTIRGESD